MDLKTYKIFVNIDVVFHEGVLPFILNGEDNMIDKVLRDPDDNMIPNLEQDVMLASNEGSDHENE